MHDDDSRGKEGGGAVTETMTLYFYLENTAILERPQPPRMNLRPFDMGVPLSLIPS